MFKDGWVYCDRCGKPIRLQIGIYIDKHHDYCANCAPLHRNGTRPHKLIVRLIKWIRRLL